MTRTAALPARPTTPVFDDPIDTAVPAAPDPARRGRVQHWHDTLSRAGAISTAPVAAGVDLLEAMTSRCPVCHEYPYTPPTWEANARGQRAPDWSGQTVGRLTILHPAAPRAHHRTRKLCWCTQCACGKPYIILAERLRPGRPLSCGCLGRARQRASLRRHGFSRTPTYQAWIDAKRSGQIVARWGRSFATFLAALGPCPPESRLTRPDPARRYGPGNAAWGPRRRRKPRSSRLYTLGGVTQSLQAWALGAGLSVRTAYTRLYAWESEHPGETLDEAALRHLLRPVGQGGRP